MAGQSKVTVDGVDTIFALLQVCWTYPACCCCHVVHLRKDRRRLVYVVRHLTRAFKQGQPKSICDKNHTSCAHVGVPNVTIIGIALQLFVKKK